MGGFNNAIVVGLVICLVACHVNLSNGHGGNENNHGSLLFSAAAQVFCGPSSYKEACIRSLGSISNKPSVTPKDLIHATIQSIITHVSGALHMSGSIAANSSSSHKMWMEDCKDLLQFTVDELHTCFSVVEETHLTSIHERQAELLNWLSAVVSYQYTCLDGILDSDLKNKMLSTGLDSANQLASNALAIVTSMSSIFSAFKIPFKIESGGIGGHSGGLNLDLGYGFSSHFGLDGGLRNALSGSPATPSSEPLEETSKEETSTNAGTGYGYPPWFSSSDRKLFESDNDANSHLTPNAIVAKDGSGNFKTIGEALAAYPKDQKGKGRYVIYVKAGIYREYLAVTKDQVNVFMYGDGPRKTIITGSKNFRDGVSTFRTATFSAIGERFVAKSIGFQNRAGPEGHQAVALRVQSDMSAFYHCRIDGSQDTLYVQTHRQFYRNCIISGTVDFIFGDAAVVIQNSLIIVRKPGPGQKNAVTAQGRVDKHQTTGIVIQNCRIVPEQKLFEERLKVATYLGRPWKQYSRTVIMESTIDDLIQPAGWLEWDGEFALDTLYYAEYANRGAGAATEQRVKWKGYKVIRDRNEALQFTAANFIQGDVWLKNTGAPYFLGFKHVK